MLDRMFINEETSLLKTDKELVAEGKRVLTFKILKLFFMLILFIQN